jgi:hypothetical protein
MTARELIQTLQNLGEENLDKEVLIYDVYRYVNIDTVKIMKDRNIYGKEREFIGID